MSGPITVAVKHLMAAGVTGEALLEAISEMESAPASQRTSKWGEKMGPEKRWGYLGPQTPRLKDDEWWPLRNEILERDKYTCAYCGTDDAQWAVDHVIPLSRGGSNERENLVACCQPCNSSKQDKLLSEWNGRLTCQ